MNKQVIIALTLILTFAATGYAAEAPKSDRVKGGLIVHVGATDGKGTISLAGDNFVVQGLSTKPEAVAAAREHLKSTGKCGKVSIDLFDGEHLPYVDELVNLIVIREAGKLTRDEIERVLVPGGHAVFAVENGKSFSKPHPKAIDDWTHYLHDPAGTSVSQDTLAGHPRGMRWTGGPYWARSHEHTNSLNAMVSAAGRMFYVMDEGPTDSIQLPAKTFLTARDAFNGVVLWKRPLKNWFNALFPLKSGPGWLPRRLVAVGQRVYIAPGVGQDMLCLDAATGKVIRTYPDTPSTFELIVSGGVIFAAVDPKGKVVDYQQENANCWAERGRASKRWGWTPENGSRVIKAIQAESGKVLWKHEGPVAPMTLSTNDKMVCFYDGSAVIALDKTTGKKLWQADVAKTKLIGTGYSGPRLVICKDRILLSPMGSMFAISIKDGKVLWSVKGKPRSGHYSLEDFFVLGDKIWVLGRRNNGVYTTYNLADGKQLDVYSNPIKSFYIHQRCYPGRATVKYQLPPVMGMTVYDMEKDTWVNNHWVRGVCVYGVMPANGLVYAGPHACACYYQSKLNGFNALSPVAQAPKAPPVDKRLTKGPALGKCKDAAKSPASWPVFRHDNTRSGYAKTDVPADLGQAWGKKFGTKLSQPVVAGGKLLVSAVDTHTVCALDAKTGKESWHFVAGGRVDSPPTIHAGMAIFGCADGNVYALRLADGKLAWRFQAAPNDRKLIAYGQAESVWPLSGSVLIQSDSAGKARLYCVAGRSMFLDGGLRMLMLKPLTGELISENVMDGKVPGTDKGLQDLMMGKHMPVTSPDILSSDGRHVYMKSQTFTMDAKRVRVRPQRPDTQYDQEVHLFSPITFLDKSWHQRTYWIYGRAAGEGWAEFQYPPKRVPCGRIMCIDEKNAYSYARDLELVCNTSVSEYRLYSAAKIPARKVGEPRLEGTWIKGKTPTAKGDQLAGNTVDWKKLAQQPKNKLSALDYNWINDEPDVMAKAMVLANDRLFIAGPRDVADEKALWGRSNDKIFQTKMQEQADWLKGAHGGVMQVYNKKTGKKLKEYKLDALPSFDGLIAAEGRLYMITDTGSIICFKGK
ncbi:MAG: PQQ-binding-like beta-propeller repeat protein [Phycisphaerae bacterium]|nr:PQQ-binding-like beta-propeller repeat protein [Phycisphaerae bacterium]